VGVLYAPKNCVVLCDLEALRQIALCYFPRRARLISRLSRMWWHDSGEQGEKGLHNLHTTT